LFPAGERFVCDGIVSVGCVDEVGIFFGEV